METELALFRFDNGLRRRPEDAEEQVHLTPEYVLGPVRAVLGGRIDLDPCTTLYNPVGAERFFALPEDGAARPWSAATVFCNPPYGEARVRWVRRCAEAAAVGSRVVLLIPAHTDTRIWHEAMDLGDVAAVHQGTRYVRSPSRERTTGRCIAPVSSRRLERRPTASRPSRLGVPAPQPAAVCIRRRTPGSLSARSGSLNNESPGCGSAAP